MSGIAYITKIEKVGRFDEKTIFQTIYGPDADKIAKRDAGTEFNANPKVLSVIVEDENYKRILELEKNPLTLTCTRRISR